MVSARRPRWLPCSAPRHSQHTWSWVRFTVSLCILCTTSCVLVAFIVAVVGRQVSHFAQADWSAVLGAGAYVRWPLHMILTSEYLLNICDVELTWAFEGSTGVITCFVDIGIVNDLRTCLTSCRVVLAMTHRVWWLTGQKSIIWRWFSGLDSSNEASMSAVSLQTTSNSWCWALYM